MKKIISILLSLTLTFSSMLCYNLTAFAAGKSSTSIVSLKSSDNTIKVKWKKYSKADGYQIKYSTSKEFKKAKTITVKSNSKSSYTIKKLKPNKKYYLKVRTFKKTDGKSTKSAWSDVKSVSTKKLNPEYGTVRTSRPSNDETSDWNWQAGTYTYTWQVDIIGGFWGVSIQYGSSMIDLDLWDSYARPATMPTRDGEYEGEKIVVTVWVWLPE